jgi:hypothetical protein
MSLPQKHILSKSTFMRGCQCPKSLWLHKYQPGLRDEMSAQQSAIFGMGTSVGELARDLFPGGVDASPPTPYEYNVSVAKTAEFLAAGHEIIYEAAFQFEGVLAALDILVKRGNKWYAYEVKSSTQVKDTFIQDVALQYYVITNSGLVLEDISLVYVNNKYIRKGALDLEQLFSRESLLQDALSMQADIARKAVELKKIISSADVPVVKLGDQCSKPYTCDFYGHCWKDVAIEIKEEIENINRTELGNFLATLRYPLYFMDFETYMLAVPGYDGHWPYRQVPFQFSVHRQENENADPEHQSFLAEVDCDPCPEFIEKLVDCLGSTGSILVYNLAFENSRLKELKKDYPQYSLQIENIQKRLVDLMVPFRQKHLYLPSMNGSYSIKAVLPALVPEMNYDGMVIGNGADASTSFYNLQFEDDATKVSATRYALLKYCEMDTLAMVRILEKMKKLF